MTVFEYRVLARREGEKEADKELAQRTVTDPEEADLIGNYFYVLEFADGKRTEKKQFLVKRATTTYTLR
jgi:hypothetical protein